MRVFLETYGCQMNVADSELLAGVLERAGFSLTDRPDAADAILVNTCAIREHAERRVLGRLGEFGHLKRKRPGLVLAVAGCMAQHMRSRLPGGWPILDLVVGPDGYRHLPDLLRRAATEPVTHTDLDPAETYGDLEPRREDGMRAWVTVQRGCDKFCAFCVVPYTRGRERSLPMADVLRQVERAATQDHREIVFLGQTVSSYDDGSHDFADLLRATQQIEGVLRIRFISPHPCDMTERVIAAMAACEKVCPHIHLPLQSASDAVLAAMNRAYTIGHYRDAVSRLREAIPGLALSTDIIVGFPGETEADFEATAAYLLETRFDSAFLFKYSARPGTGAWGRAETVAEDEKHRRLAAVIELQQRISGERNASWIGREVEVLVEGPARRGAGQLHGRSPQFKGVVFPDDGTPAGSPRRVRVIGATSNTLLAVAAGCPDATPAPAGR